tara:strand:+ start:133305 stop:133964 length:660 start_codon:yes stop_codon:yes gene_type:complete
MNISDNLNNILIGLPKNTTLIAVSKTQSEDDILNVYKAGHKIFGENKIQEMTRKWENLPKDIQWHMIGHVQSNKVKYMAKFVSLIHGVDNMKLINVINKQGDINGRIIKCLLQVNISNESNKYGLNEIKLFEILEYLKNNDSIYKNIRIIGLMGMASFTNDYKLIKTQFKFLQDLFLKIKKMNSNFTTLSMGMSNDYLIAIKNGSNMIRIGTKIFGKRN